MSARVPLFLGVMIAAVAALVVLRNWTESAETRQPPAVAHSTQNETPRQPASPAPPSPSSSRSIPSDQLASAPLPAEAPTAATGKLDRLAEIRENFRALARGNPIIAMQAARKLADSTERETALLSLVTEWTNGELSPPVARARAILQHGLEAGLGMELARTPQLAALWAAELTESQGRFALLAAAGANLLESDPSAALALGQQLPENERHEFSDALLTTWAQKDTQAALEWVNQMADPAERELALQSIRQVAPVGIGAAVAIQGGYPVILNLVPDSPAARDGQLGKGDRIVALAPDGSALVDARDLRLETVVNMIRGAPGTLLHLQVQPADAPPGSPPRNIWITRDQITFKR